MWDKKMNELWSYHKGGFHESHGPIPYIYCLDKWPHWNGRAGELAGIVLLYNIITNGDAIYSSYIHHKGGSARAELFESHVLITIDTIQGTSHQILWEAHLNQLLHLHSSAQTKGHYCSSTRTCLTYAMIWWTVLSVPSLPCQWTCSLRRPLSSSEL